MQRQSCASQKEKKHTTTTKAKNKTNVQTDCIYKHMVFREENSDEITSVLRNSNFNIYIYRV